MSKMREHKMNFWRHKTNEANRGFFPTEEKIVEMEMDLIDFSQLEKDSVLNIADLSGGTGEQLYEMHKYISDKELSPISYYNEVTRERFEITKDKYEQTDNFNLLNADFFNIKVRNDINKKAFTIIRNNPPYGWMDYKSNNIRMEDIFFTANAEMQVDYGIQIFELPIHQLVQDKNLIRKIFYRYENIHILKFPKQNFDKKQVCVIGTRKRNNSNDIDLAEKWREKLIAENILSLDEVDKPLIKLDPRAIKNTRPIILYRDKKPTDITLTKGFNIAFEDLVNETVSKAKNKEDLGLKVPIIEELPGHIASSIYSGQFDGLIGDVLIKGGVEKGVKIIVETNDKVETTTEVEYVYPFVEITSSSGDTLVKAHDFKEEDEGADEEVA